MGTYTSQAGKYQSDSASISENLGSVVATINEINGILESNQDPISSNLINNNETITSRTKSIISKRESIGSSLMAKAEEIDARIEAEERAAREREAESQNSGKTYSTTSQKGANNSKVNVENRNERITYF